MKTAKLSVMAFEVQCPHCKESVASSYWGSLMWTLFDGDINVGIVAGQQVECSECGEIFKLPKVVSENKLPEAE